MYSCLTLLCIGNRSVCVCVLCVVLCCGVLGDVFMLLLLPTLTGLSERNSIIN